MDGRSYTLLCVLYLLTQLAFGELRGSEACPCVNPWDDILNVLPSLRYFDPSTGKHCLQYTGGASHSEFCYPVDYGASKCRAWDRNLQPHCSAPTGEPLMSAPSWCTELWCFVNAANCKLSPVPSIHFAEYPLSVSYKTCNVIDFSKDKPLERLRGHTFAVGVVATERPYIFRNRHTGEATGATVDFMATMGRLGGFDLQIRNVSQASKAEHPESSYTACVRDVSLNLLDMCFGAFWETPERLSMTLFSPSYVMDTFRLITFMTKEAPLFEALLLVFAPFSAPLWGIIALSALLVGLFTYLTEVFGPRTSISPTQGVLIGFSQAIMQFLGQSNDFMRINQRDHTAAGVVLFGFSFMCMVGSASYIAQMSSLFMVENMKTDMRHIHDVIQSEATICIVAPIKHVLLASYPALAPLLITVTGVEYDAIADGMDARQCDVGLLNDNEYQKMRASGQKHCNKVRLRDPVVEIPMGFPLQQEMSLALSSLFVKARASGVWVDSLAKYSSWEDKCSNEDLKGVKPLQIRHMGGVLMILLASLLVGTIMWKTRRWRERLEKATDNMFKHAGSGMESSVEATMRTVTDHVESTLNNFEQRVLRFGSAGLSSDPVRTASAGSLVDDVSERTSSLETEVALLRKDMSALRSDLSRMNDKTISTI